MPAAAKAYASLRQKRFVVRADMLPSLRPRAPPPPRDDSQTRLHQRVLAMLLLVASVIWGVPRLLLDAPAAVLDAEDDRQRRRALSDRMARWKPTRHLQAVHTDAGTVVMALVVAEGAWQLCIHAWSRSLHLTLALGVGRGTALAVLGLIVAAQTLSVAILLLPALYTRSGSMVPSAALAAALWLEALVFGDLSDRATQARGACLTATACMLAIFRFDQQARTARDQLPASNMLLGIEATVRSVCTRVHTGLLLPPIAVGLFVWAVAWNSFWNRHAALYEWERARCQSGLSMAALSLLLAGQDTASHVVCGDRLEKVFHWILCKKDDLIGGHAERREGLLGAKKSL